MRTFEKTYEQILYASDFDEEEQEGTDDKVTGIADAQQFWKFKKIIGKIDNELVD